MLSGWSVGAVGTGFVGARSEQNGQLSVINDVGGIMWGCAGGQHSLFY